MFPNILKEARFQGQGWHRPSSAGKIYIDFGSLFLESKNSSIKDYKPVTMWSLKVYLPVVAQQLWKQQIINHSLSITI